MYDDLPAEILSLALPAGALPDFPPGVIARQLIKWVGNQTTYGSWTSIEELYRMEGTSARTFKKLHRLLVGAHLHHNRDFNGPQLAVARVERHDIIGKAWFAVIEGEVLRHRGRALLFSHPRRAQNAASGGAVVRRAQHVFSLAPAALQYLGTFGCRVTMAPLSPQEAADQRARWSAAYESCGSPLDGFSLAVAELHGAIQTAGGAWRGMNAPIDWVGITVQEAAEAAVWVRNTLARLDCAMALKDHPHLLIAPSP